LENKTVSNETRKDYLLNRWVIIARGRNKRPTDFAKNAAINSDGVCPLCAGNEHMTPPATLVYLSSENGKLVKQKDPEGGRHKDWLLRVIPNLYPFVTPPNEDTQNTDTVSAVGHHEVVIESSCHAEQPANTRVSQLVLVINAYLDRLAAFSKEPYVKHVTIFRNYGHEAGASLSHPHSQLVTTTFLPTILNEELKTSRSYWNQNSRCIFCDIIKKETASERFIWENQSFVVFAPWASVNPMEFWVFPKRHNSNMQNMTNTEVNDLAETLRVCFAGLRDLLNDPPYNFGVHTLLVPDAKDCYHWHLEVYPRLAIWAGFEKTAGVYVNMISPENAAKELRVAVLEQKKTLQ
jgi:UDPglucose--hexose-1-phosphate uridylyltransferase